MRFARSALSKTAFAAVFAAALAGAPAAFAQQMTQDPSAAPAGTYHLDKKHASVTLKLSHMGLSYYTMRFDGIDAAYTYDPANPAASKIRVTIDPKSIDTDNAPFNAEIADQFLEAGKYPTITFVSTAVHPGAGGKGEVVGDLTFHGVTRPVVLDVVFNGTGLGMMHEQRMGFSGVTTIKRSDFGVTKYVPLVGDEVTVLIETEFTR
jgi:polyisoprenoid-binding protein YceI